jgi:hypothetical protein
MSILFGNVRVRVRPKPIGQRILARHLWIERVGVAGCNYGVENVPNRIAIRFYSRANVQHEAKTNERRSTSGSQREPGGDSREFLLGTPRPARCPSHFVYHALQFRGRFFYQGCRLGECCAFDKDDGLNLVRA